MTIAELDSAYTRRLGALELVAGRLEGHIASCLEQCSRIDRITARAKSKERFLVKATKMEEGSLKYSDPLSQIQDQVGARIVTFYLSDVTTIAAEVERYFRPIESRLVFPDSDSEFGYFGKHYIFFLPDDVQDNETLPHCPKFFELQIKTLFQHAWSEANHDSGYKPFADLTSSQRRRLAFTAAQAWGADHIFGELIAELSDSP